MFATSRYMKPDFALATFAYDPQTPNVEADIPGATVTVTPDVSALVMIFVSMLLQNNSDTDRVIVYLRRDGTLLAEFDTKFFALGTGQPEALMYFDDNVSAASHTYKLTWVNTHAGDQLGAQGRIMAVWYAT